MGKTKRTKSRARLGPTKRYVGGKTVKADAKKFRRFGGKKSGETTMLFQIGRVCCINYGDDAGKLCVILDFVDSTRALIDGPEALTGVKRQTIPFKRLSILPIKVNCMRSQPPKSLIKMFKAADVMNKWAKLPWAKKQAQQEKRANLNDFERFKVCILRQKRAALVRDEMKKLKVLKYYNRRYHKTPAPVSKKDLYWKAKKAGDSPDYWKKTFRPKAAFWKNADGKRTRTRTRGKTRSKKKSVETLAASRAFSHAKRAKLAQSAKKRSPEDKANFKKRKPKRGVTKFPDDPVKRKQMILKRLMARRKRKRLHKKSQKAKKKVVQTARNERVKARKALMESGEKLGGDNSLRGRKKAAAAAAAESAT